MSSSNPNEFDIDPVFQGFIHTIAFIFNPVMCVLALGKIYFIVSPRVNKTYSRISIWILVSTFLGVFGMSIRAAELLWDFCILDSLMLHFFQFQPLYATVTQAFEWESMVDIILEQKATCMEEFLSIMKDKKTRDKYRKMERWHLFYYVLVIITLTLLLALWLYTFTQKMEVLCHILTILINISLIAMLSVSYVRINKYIARYHPDKFEVQNK